MDGSTALEVADVEHNYWVDAVRHPSGDQNEEVSVGESWEDCANGSVDCLGIRVPIAAREVTGGSASGGQ